MNVLIYTHIHGAFEVSHFCTVSCAAVEEDRTSGLVIEVFVDWDKVGGDVILLHGCPQSCMPNPVEGLEIYEDVVEVLPVLEIQLTEDSLVEDPLCLRCCCSEVCLFFSDDLLRFWLQSVQYDLQRDFAWMANEADCSVVLALLQVAFLGKCND